MRYKYGDSWEKYPIKAGEVWIEQKTSSIVQVCDLFDGLPDFMMEADLIYCDPPWDVGCLKSFYTKADRSNDGLTFEAFTDMFFGHIEAIMPRVCYLEIGQRNEDIFVGELQNLYDFVERWSVTYYRKHPSVLLRASNDGTGPYNFDGVDDMKTPRLAMEHEDFECVADLCMGQGLTGLTAFKLGKRFVGTEMNRRRLAVLIDKTTKAGAQWAKM